MKLGKKLIGLWGTSTILPTSPAFFVVDLIQDICRKIKQIFWSIKHVGGLIAMSCVHLWELEDRCTSCFPFEHSHKLSEFRSKKLPLLSLSSKFSKKEKTCWHVQAGEQKRATLGAKVVQKLQQKRPQSDFAMNFLAKKSLEKLNLAFWVLLLVFFIFFVNHQVITQVSLYLQN